MKEVFLLCSFLAIFQHEIKCIILMSPTSSSSEPVAAFCDWVTALPEAPEIALCGGMVQVVMEPRSAR